MASVAIAEKRSKLVLVPVPRPLLSPSISVFSQAISCSLLAPCPLFQLLSLSIFQGSLCLCLYLPSLSRLNLSKIAAFLNGIKPALRTERELLPLVLPRGALGLYFSRAKVV